MEGQSKRSMEVEPVILFSDTVKSDELGNNPFDVLTVEDELDQSVKPEALPFVPASSPASPETAAAATAHKKSVDNNEFKMLQSAKKKLYAKQGQGPAHSATYQLKES